MIACDGKPHGYIELYLADYNAEYPPPHSTMIFDPYRLEDLLGEEVVHSLWDKLPAELRDKYEEHFFVWEMTGKLADIQVNFSEYVKELMEGPQGADDDTYDYWPSAMTVAYQLAQDLDKLTSSTTYTDHLRSSYEQSGLNVSEFEPEWSHA